MKKKGKKVDEDKWDRRLKYAIFCSNFMSYVILLMFIFGLVRKIFHRGSQASEFVLTTSITVNGSHNIQYFDPLMMNDEVDPCVDYMKYVCGGRSPYRRDTEFQVQYLLGRADEALMAGIPDRVEEIGDVDLNVDMQSLLASCVNHGGNVNQVDDTLKICSGKSIRNMIRLIDSIETPDHLILVLKLIMEDCNNVILPFGMEIIESPVMVELGGERRVAMYYHLHHNHDHGTTVDKLLILAGENTESHRDGWCSTNCELRLLSTHAGTPCCVSSKSYFSQLIDNLNSPDNLESWKVFLIRAIRFSAGKTIEVVSSLDLSVDVCLKEIVIPRFRNSYCRLVVSLVHNHEAIIRSVREFSSVYVQTFADWVEDGGLNDGCSITSNDLAALRNVKIEIIGCGHSEIDEMNYIKHESNLKLDPNNLINNIFKTTIPGYQAESAVESLTGSLRYLEGEHKIVIPLGEVIEPKYSVFHNEASTLGTIGFKLGHELTHALLRLTSKNEGCSEPDNHETFCDVVSLEFLSSVASPGDFEGVMNTAAQMLCSEIKWTYYGSSSDGHMNPGMRVDNLVGETLKNSKIRFNERHGCQTK